MSKNKRTKLDILIDKISLLGSRPSTIEGSRPSTIEGSKKLHSIMSDFITNKIKRDVK